MGRVGGADGALRTRREQGLNFLSGDGSDLGKVAEAPHPSLLLVLLLVITLSITIECVSTTHVHRRIATV